MRRVIDSSVAFKWVVPEQNTDKALLLRDDFRNGLIELLAPDVFAVEIAHGLTRAERQGRIAVSEAATFWTDAMKTAPLLFASLPLMPRAIEISSQMRVGVYDCLYVALAEKENCDFVSADGRLVKMLQPHFPFIVELAALP
jgi:predicted nucleic acid-binding protein